MNELFTDNCTRTYAICTLKNGHYRKRLNVLHSSGCYWKLRRNSR